MKELVVFDIDNTLLRGQAQHEFLKFARSSKLIGLLPYLKINLWFLFYKLGIADDPKAIMEYAFSFIKSWPLDKFESLLAVFFETKLVKLIYPSALQIIKEHKEKGREVIFISNIIEPLVSKIAKYCEISVFKGSPLEIVDNHYTGKLGSGGIMYGKNKFDSLEEILKSMDIVLPDVWAYGDHISDAAVLEKVGHPYAVNPSSKLAVLANKLNWPILEFQL